MKALRRAYDLAVIGLAVLAGALLALISAAIVIDVTFRAIGLPSVPWVVEVTKLGLIYITLLGAPWLVREKGHVGVEILVAKLSPGMRRRFGQAVCLVCALMCLLLAYRAVGVMLESIGQVDASDLPRWARFAPLPVGFFFLSTEFLRLLVISQPLFAAGERVSL